MIDTDKIITVRDAAAQLGYHPDHIYRLLAQGTIKGQKLGYNWIIDQDEIDRIKALQDEHGRLPRSDRE